MSAVATNNASARRTATAIVFGCLAAGAWAASVRAMDVPSVWPAVTIYGPVAPAIGETTEPGM